MSRPRSRSWPSFFDTFSPRPTPFANAPFLHQTHPTYAQHLRLTFAQKHQQLELARLSSLLGPVDPQGPSLFTQLKTSVVQVQDVNNKVEKLEDKVDAGQGAVDDLVRKTKTKRGRRFWLVLFCFVFTFAAPIITFYGWAVPAWTTTPGFIKTTNAGALLAQLNTWLTHPLFSSS